MCAWWYQVGSAKRGHWPDFEAHIQGHGNLGRQYPEYRFGVEGDDSLDILTLKPRQGATAILDASETTDPDGDALSFKWWVQPEAGSYTGTVEIRNRSSNQASIEIPEDSAGETFHVICEVRDDGVPNLTSYRRIIFAAQAPKPTPK